jgi:NAD(P)-dependent dehydrogenase (short-subunit alcohol dehydrogenase family)
METQDPDPLPQAAPRPGRAVLVTGCSSGIGRAIALHLAERGYLALATVRREEQARELGRTGKDNLVPLWPLDLTRAGDIPPLFAALTAELDRRGVDGLHGLVNNAGGSEVGPAELLPPDRLEKEMKARLVGPLALVQACLPLIRRARGRIIWVATPALVPTPYVAGIHACDFAVNCLARTLDIELQAWEIPNILLRCGGIKTPAGFRTGEDAEACLRRAPADRAALYAEALRRWVTDMASFDAKRTDPERVAEAAAAALEARRPRRRYSVGHMARAAALLEALPQGVADRILRRRFRP